LRGRARRTEDAAPVGAEGVDDPAVERRFGTDDREIDPLATREGEDRVGIGRIDGHEPGDRGDSGIAWRTHQRRNTGVAGQAPREGVLGAAAAGDENLHPADSIGKSVANRAVNLTVEGDGHEAGAWMFARFGP